ncbi:HUN domain-containing protein [Citrus sinensis]|nr:HUN domain-containing protein [Citrus sinensis]
MEGDNNNIDNSSSSTGTGRLRFYIELKPGETTIVSWKKLIKEANNNNKNSNKTDPPTILTPSVQQKAEEVQFALDEYFQDENPTTEYNDFTIRKGIMEHSNEPVSSSDCQLKKRKTHIPKGLVEKVDDHVPNKHAKLGHARLKAAKNVTVVGQSSSHSQSLAASREHYHDRKLQHPLDSPIGFSKKKHDDTSTKSEYSMHSGISDDASAGFLNSQYAEKQRPVTSQCRNAGNNLKERKYVEKIDSEQLEFPAKRMLTDTSGHEFSTKARQREKNGSSGLPDLNIPASPVEPVAFEEVLSRKSQRDVHANTSWCYEISQKSATSLKDIPTLRPKGTTLERAIRDLEKVVAESRPPNVEVQDADTSSPAFKRRLPHEVKQKLAKVARLAQSSQGKISEELVNRLMSILGHLVQLRTLKRNLREMVLLGLSAKREKADRIQLIKNEVIEMIKLQANKLTNGAADDFQDTFHSEEKGFQKEKFCINSMLEDKICDLYDLYIQGMDEDKGPQIRKLYAELAELWPEGTMDNHGIKKAICRAKERRRASYDDEKVREKARGQKLPMARTEVAVCGEVSSTAQAKAVPERIITVSNTLFLGSPSKMISSATALNHHLTAPVRTSSLMLKSFNMDFPKQEKLERTAYPTLKEQPKQEECELESKVSKLSLRPSKESHKALKRTIGQSDGLTCQTEKDRRPSM